MMFTKTALASCALVAASLTQALASSALAAPAAQIRLASSSLGDLTPYRTIAADTLKIVETGNLPAAKARIKDLETAWDDAEAGMKPKDRTTWSAIDKSIDGALSALRSDAPKQTECAASVKALIAKMDDVSKA